MRSFLFRGKEILFDFFKKILYNINISWGEKVKKKIEYSRVYCETCNDYHYKYWLDGSEEIIDEEDVDELLSTGMYYVERKAD